MCIVSMLLCFLAKDSFAVVFVKLQNCAAEVCVCTCDSVRHRCLTTLYCDASLIVLFFNVPHVSVSCIIFH